MLVAAVSPIGAAAAELNAITSDALRPGYYAWGDGPASGVVRIVIDRARQLAYVYRGDTLVGLSTVSTGKRGKRTPLGTFAILQKAARHRSNKYSNAPMPFMQRLTWDGIALHAGQLPGYPASHGCIRLPWAFAQKLFTMTSLGAAVEITDSGPQLPRVEMAAAKPAAPPAPKLPVAREALAATTAPSAPLVVPPVSQPVLLAGLATPQPVPVLLALAAPLPYAAPGPPRLSWKEQAAEDYVSWGSRLGS